MPSLRMKKSSVCCVKEKKCLRVSHKSCTISKKSHLKISHVASEDDTICEGCHEASSSTESNMQDREIAGASNSNELLSDEDLHVKQLPRSFNDAEVIKEVESQQVSCSANFVTIFSPAVSHIDGYDVPNSCDNSAVNRDQDFICLSCAEESDDNSGSSSDHQSCNISEFFISDMVLAGSPYDGSFMCDDIAEALIFPEHDTAESSIFFDVTEGHMSLPFLDDSVESSEMVDVRSSDESRMNYDNSSLCFAIHQIRPGDQEADLGHCVESNEAPYFDPHSFIINLPELSDVVPNGRPTILPKESREKKPVTLVLDLDETLVHSTLEHCDDADFTFSVSFNMKEHPVYVKERPHLRTFLKKVEEMFQIVVFTASQSIYAEQLLDILDPEGKLISGRAYRESCIFSDGSYTKDLTVLGLDLAKVVIIDNSPQVFRLQVNNGIPIKSWFDDPSDNELISLIPFLETLANTDDVRPLIAKRFGNKE